MINAYLILIVFHGEQEIDECDNECDRVVQEKEAAEHDEHVQHEHKWERELLGPSNV